MGNLDYSGIVSFKFFDTSNTSLKAGTDFFSVRGDHFGNNQFASLVAYDVDGLVLDTDIQADLGGNTFTVASASKVIHRGDFIGTGTIALDDVMFNAATPVPEPPTMALAGLGLAAATRRRRANRVRSG